VDRFRIGGREMSFAGISEAYFAASPETRHAATFEYLCSTGPLIAPGIHATDEATLIRADGRVEYRRRGDFGERGDCPPGAWAFSCDTARVERIWDKLGEIGPESFPSRVADPGDAIRILTACAAGRLQTLSIGPSDPSLPVPGQEFLNELYPVLGQPESGECLWAVEMGLVGMKRESQGARAVLRFRNPGKQPIGLVFDGVPGVADFHLRFAQDRANLPYPEWHHFPSRPAEKDRAGFRLLDPGVEYIQEAFFPCSFPDDGKYMGAISYKQTAFVDSLAGFPILTGMAFTGVAEFEV
jgi:hypothetical protein